jgi:hypothetical protein
MWLTNDVPDLHRLRCHQRLHGALCLLFLREEYVLYIRQVPKLTFKFSPKPLAAPSRRWTRSSIKYTASRASSQSSKSHVRCRDATAGRASCSSVTMRPQKLDVFLNGDAALSQRRISTGRSTTLVVLLAKRSRMWRRVVSLGRSCDQITMIV